MSCWALVPVKARAAGKQRLAAVLTAEARTTLVREMLDHVLSVVSACPEVSDVAVLTPERDLLPAAVPVVPDAGTGLNDALAAALPHLRERRAQQVLIVAADLPLLTTPEIVAMIEAAADGIALAPDARGTGTNSLCLGLLTRFAPQFGIDSLARHVAEARRVGLAPILVRRRGLEFDVDEPDDLTEFRKQS